MCNDNDFDVRVFEYLKDKFPGHKLSDYEEACAYLTYQMLLETNKQVKYYTRITNGGRRPK